MVANKFEDPQSFLESSIFSYLSPDSSSSEDAHRQRWSAIAKRYPQHFIVREGVPGIKGRYLSIGTESDYPAEVLAQVRHADSVVVATLVKERLVTWAAIDWLADLLTKVLGRKIWPEQVRHSGLKDRWAVTAQTILIFGVTVEELNRVVWPYTQGKTGFFLKDIHWHDGRRRVHPAFDEKRNRVYTEVQATVVRKGTLSREAALERIRGQVSKALGREFKHDDFKINNAGEIRICKVTASEIGSIVWAGEQGVGLKDVRIYKSNALSKGDHRHNLFQLKVLVKGKAASEVGNYLEPRMEKLDRLSYCIPNAINWQRLAARQLGHLHGYTLITGDYKAPKGVHAFGSASEAALYRFLHEVSGRENPAAEAMRHEMEPLWLYDFGGMKQRLSRSYRQLNMSVEYKVVERLADNDRYRGDFQEIVKSMSEEVSMWVAAWQSWWWNQVLVRKLPHWVREMEAMAAARKQAESLCCTCPSAAEALTCHGQVKGRKPASCKKCELDSTLLRFNPLQKGIPLLMDSAQAREYYERLPYCREALAHLGKADNFVRGQFLKPRGNTPWRKAFIRVEGLEYGVSSEQVDGVEQTVVNLQFELPSGAYATTFLGLLFELEEPNKAAPRNGAAESEPAADVDETE